MVILIMALFAILAFLASMTIKKSGIRYAVTLIMFAGLILSVIMVIANMHDHYGMTSVTTTTKKKFTPQVQVHKILVCYCTNRLELTAKKMLIFIKLQHKIKNDGG